MTSTMDTVMPSMPGSFLFQHDHSRVDGRSHNIFQPPAPSPSPLQRSQIPRSVSRSSNSFSGRKRPRLDSNTSYFSRPTRPAAQTRSTAATPYTLDGSYDHVAYTNLDSSTYSLEDQCPLSPSPLANSEYKLAGGLDTPSASMERGLEELAQDEAEQDYRLNRYTTTNTSRTTLSVHSSDRFSSKPQTPNPHTTASNGRKRIRSSTSNNRYSGSLTGWGIRSTAWALTGGLAGRVFNFCINTAFGGFGAGGGDTYRWDVVTPEVDVIHSAQINSDFDVLSNGVRQPLGLPGTYTSDFGGFVDDYMNSPEVNRTTSGYASAVDQLQWSVTSADLSTIKNDWQIVDQVDPVESGDEQSPVRKRSRASVAGGWQRAISRSPTNSRTNSTGASYASSRARIPTGLPVQQRAVSSAPLQPVRRVRPSTGSPRRSHSYFPASNALGINVGNKSPERPSSSASVRRHRSDSTKQDYNFNADLSPEVHNYKRKLKQHEKTQDENLKRLNAQLRDMIREGREALGSKIEILDGHTCGGDIDEGYYEDDWK